MINKRILFVNHAAVLGGAELCLIDLAVAYSKTSQVLLFDEGPLQSRLGSLNVAVNTISAPGALLSVRTSSRLSGLTAFPALWWMARRIVEQSKGFDIIHANSQKAFAAAALARWMGGPPVIWHLRDIITAKHFSSLNRWLAITLANSQASKVFVNSNATREAFIAAGGNANLVHVLHDGISSVPFDEINREQTSAIRTEIGISEQIPLIGCFSRLSYWKGQHILLEAIQDLPNVHVMFVGKALFGEEDYVNRLNELASSPKLSGRVHWMGFRSDVPVLMSACDIITHTSTEPEPFGRVIIEGQLAKKPVIATAAGGAQELIEDGTTGRLVPPGKSYELRKVIEEILSCPTQAEEMARYGYNRASAEFSLDVHLKRFSDALDL